MTGTFHEDWFGEESQKALAAIAHTTSGLVGDVVEVGCWEGRSTVALANAVRPQIVKAVDTWEGSPGEISAELACARDIYATFESNIALLTERNVTPFRMGWRDYFAKHRTPVRLIHIDAAHTYDEVRDNIAEVLPLVVRGGIIVGDDNHHPPIQQAVADTLGDVKLRATLWYWRQPWT